ncbi:uncharacterized protein B0H18DRAFT_1125239 [Fomitopsis serialis]|uniref:uncharacterized protein n=1 Tax=Fomitopsis serialis TaxID=139415 RepID=UPI0020089CA7|nr:uncharacterized protein B0H18DRAFT_1125239 [Neoantrodia serialis]KAH9914852.1 hypothetical protein B0H18DRAFT_1125239 [Neoantrodia serialis]
MGGWVFAGAIGDFYQNWVIVPRLLQLYRPEDAVAPKTAVVEALFFISDFKDPISIPLLCEIDKTCLQMLIPCIMEQPLLGQIFPGLSPWRPLPQKGLGDSGFDFYNYEKQTFIPTTMLPTNPLSLPLPLPHIPTFKLRHVRVMLYMRDHARGTCFEHPLCSMKHQFMDQEYVWPADLRKPRTYVQGQWKITGPGSPLGIIAVRPMPREEGCMVLPGVEHGGNGKDTDARMASEA